MIKNIAGFLAYNTFRLSWIVFLMSIVYISSKSNYNLGNNLKRILADHCRQGRVEIDHGLDGLSGLSQIKIKIWDVIFHLYLQISIRVNPLLSLSKDLRHPWSITKFINI